jgi:alkylated DNA repair dioxygenase AlkB
MQLSIFERPIKILSDGAYHIPNFLSVEEQIALLETCRQGLRELRAKGYDLEHPQTMSGEMKVGVASLGWWWTLQHGYFPARVPVPKLVYDLSQRAVARVSLTPLGSIETVSAIMQHYDCQRIPSIKLGLHRDDSEEASLLNEYGPPVVSFSLGCSAIFLWGGTERSSPVERVELLSGDVVVFGKKSRLNYHGIAKVIPGTEPALLRTRGRLNITVRQAVRESSYEPGFLSPKSASDWGSENQPVRTAEHLKQARQTFIVRAWNDDDWGDEPPDPDDIWSTGDRVRSKESSLSGEVRGVVRTPFLGGFLNYIRVRWDGWYRDELVDPDSLFRLTRYIPEELFDCACDGFSDLK